jgi:hypothetical protein
LTRDLDIVVSLGEDDVGGIVAALSPDFYIDADSVRTAVTMDRAYLERWASRLGVAEALAEIVQ